MTGNRSASDYIALYNGKSDTLAESLAVIQQTAHTILEDLLPEERTRPAESRDAQELTTFTEERSDIPDPHRPQRASEPDRADAPVMDR